MTKNVPRIDNVVVKGSRCWFCGEHFERGVGPKSPTLEHLVAKANGGGRGSNLVLAHKGCNSWAGSISVERKWRLRRFLHDHGFAKGFKILQAKRTDFPESDEAQRDAIHHP